MLVSQISAYSLLGSRATQEDRYICSSRSDHAFLFIICDGIGGHKSGQVASSIASKSFEDNFWSNFENSVPIDIALESSVIHANKSIHYEIGNYPELEGMGTTLLALYISLNTHNIYWVSVGDSPFWNQTKEQQLFRVNPPHTYEVNSKEFLYSALTGGSIERVDKGELNKTEQTSLLLASDGILTLSLEQINNTIQEYKTSVAVVNSLISQIEAIAKTNQDNTTLIFINLED